jgi:hypothetical protein
VNAGDDYEYITTFATRTKGLAMMFADMGPEVVAIFIPIIAILGGCAIAVAAVIGAGKKKELEHRERVIALEKGIPLPEAQPEPVKRPAFAGRRAAGLVIFAFGIALTLGISVAESFQEGVWGLLFIFVGIGLLIAAFLDKREYMAEKQEKQQDQPPM